MNSEEIGFTNGKIMSIISSQGTLSFSYVSFRIFNANIASLENPTTKIAVNFIHSFFLQI